MFYANVFDPLLIISQMVVLQCLFYLGVGAWLLVFAITFGTQLNLHAIFAASQLHMAHSSGWTPIGAFLFVAPIMSVARQAQQRGHHSFIGVAAGGRTDVCSACFCSSLLVSPAVTCCCWWLVVRSSASTSR